VYRFGAVPAVGASLRSRRYLYGGGVQGNVPARALSVLKASIPYVARVVNHAPAVGGRNAQTLEDAMMRVPQQLRTRSRAVTADDFEYLATQVPGVARASCITPNAALEAGETSFPGQIRTLDVQPGQVSVVILPRGEVTAGRVPPERLGLSAELRASVQNYLNERRMVGTVLEVRSPQYFWVSVSALLRVPPGTSPRVRADVQRAAEAALYAYLNPYVGGPERTGWPFRRGLYLAELYALLRTVPGADFVEDVQVFLSDPGHPDEREPAGPQVLLPPQGLIVSDVHTVRVE
jgi:predicted phage baseplate assembly protein